MNKNGRVMLKESVHAPRRVAWLCVGKTYQIRTENTIFTLAKVLHKGEGSIQVAFSGVPRAKYLRRPDTPLFKALQPVQQIAWLRISTILEAQEVL